MAVVLEFLGDREGEDAGFVVLEVGLELHTFFETKLIRLHADNLYIAHTTRAGDAHVEDIPLRDVRVVDRARVFAVRRALPLRLPAVLREPFSLVKLNM